MDMMLDSRGKEASATRSVYLRLRQMILTGALPAGEKLKIELLRTRLDVGASPLREALSLLTSDLLVERIDQRGFRTAQVGKANFDEILMLRCLLEEKALRLSIANADAAWEERLILAHHHMRKARSLGTEAFEDAHKMFHMTILSNCGLPTLLRYCTQLYDLNIRYRYLASGGKGYRARDIDAEHQNILEAAIDGDIEQAAGALLSHYKLTGAYLIGQMSE